MNTTNYQKALRYALKLKYSDHMDLVHDAYVRWFDKTGEDLFDKPLHFALKVIKLTFFDLLKRGNYQTGPKGNQNGPSGKFVIPKEKKRRVFVNYDEHNTVCTTPEDELIAKELDEYIRLYSPDLQLEIYLYVVQGYRPFEIAEIMNMSKSHVSYYFSRIRHIVSFFN